MAMAFGMHPFGILCDEGSRSGGACGGSPGPAGPPQQNPGHQLSDDEIAALGTRFAEIVPSNELSPAEVQGYLLKHKHNPTQAVDGAAAWALALRAEKRKGHASSSTGDGSTTPATSEQLDGSARDDASQA
jgi:hypothetical protein